MKAVTILVTSVFCLASACGGGGAARSSGAGGSVGSGGTSVGGASGSVGSGEAGNGTAVGAAGSGDTTGSAGAAGVTGAAGETDTSGAAGTAGGSGAAGAVGAAGGGGTSGGSDAGVTSRAFVCTELVGLWVASQWWDTFEKGVNGDQWEFMFQHHGYLEMFADPTSPYWNNAVSSKCTMDAATPDRIVFLPFSLSLNTMDEWVTNLTMVVQTIKGKFPSVERIELMTTLRSPGNMPCANDTDPNTVVAPYVDAAIQMVADASGGLVTVGPKIELTSCSWWAGGTDLTGAGNTGAGQLLAAYYQTH
jgi:hypothetical protein